MCIRDRSTADRATTAGGQFAEVDVDVRELYEFAFRTEEGKFFDLCVDSLEARDMWVQVRTPLLPSHDAPAPHTCFSSSRALHALPPAHAHAHARWMQAMPAPPSYAMSGYVIERYHIGKGIAQGKRKRFAVFHLSLIHISEPTRPY